LLVPAPLKGERREIEAGAWPAWVLGRSRGRANHENVVTAGRATSRCALGRLLAAHVFEIYGKMLQLTSKALQSRPGKARADHAHDHGVSSSKHIEQQEAG